MIDSSKFSFDTCVDILIFGFPKHPSILKPLKIAIHKCLETDVGVHLKYVENYDCVDNSKSCNY